MIPGDWTVGSPTLVSINSIIRSNLISGTYFVHHQKVFEDFRLDKKLLQNLYSLDIPLLNCTYISRSELRESLDKRNNTLKSTKSFFYPASVISWTWFIGHQKVFWLNEKSLQNLLYNLDIPLLFCCNYCVF